MQITFILVQPARGENIGFAARALQTMGFSDLRVVNSEAHLSAGAKKTAYGSHEVLNKIQLFATLEEALQDVDLSIGTTAKSRIKRYDYHDPHKVGELVADKASSLKRVALVFGSEENGLSTDQIDQCDLLSTIALKQSYPSLNLAQAVLIYAYELSNLAGESEREVADDQLLNQLKGQSQALLNRLGYEEKPLVKQRIMDRLLTASSEDMTLILNLISKVERALNQSSKEA